MYYRPDEPEGMERDFFKILEGAHRNKIACVKTSSGLSSHASSSRWFQAAYPTGAAYLKFVTDRVSENEIHGVLTFSGTTIKAFTTITVPGTSAAQVLIKAGEYWLKIPDAPHLGGQHYTGRCKSPSTWFRIVHAAGGYYGERYLHPGQVSAGCITVLPEGWDKLYDYLINARIGDMQNVGKIQVVHS
jgi:hypothetical protein